MYKALRSGWQPPETVSRAEYHAAKVLPDTDPRKAFIGFSSSYRSRYFGGYYGCDDLRRGDPVRANLRDLMGTLPLLVRYHFQCQSFLDTLPNSILGTVYCDPPYEGTIVYSHIPRLDYARFWSHCQKWARTSSVYVSEYRCPVPHELVLERVHEAKAGHGRNHVRCIERLFKVLPLRSRFYSFGRVA